MSASGQKLPHRLKLATSDISLRTCRAWMRRRSGPQCWRPVRYRRRDFCNCRDAPTCYRALEKQGRSNCRAGGQRNLTPYPGNTMESNSPGKQKSGGPLQASGFLRRRGWCGFAKEPGSRPNRCSEWEQADSPRDKSTIIGGWLPSLTAALSVPSVKSVVKAFFKLAFISAD